jgi:HSP20 family protein
MSQQRRMQVRLPVIETELEVENMANITRFNPSRDIASLDPFSEFDDLFRGFFLRPLGLRSRSLDQPGQMKVDVTENDKEYRVLADVPGVRKEDISVTIDGDEVAISAEMKRENDVKEKEGAVRRSERYYGKVYRAFSLGEDVDQAKAEAKYIDGVLTLTLPKKAPAETKTTTIAVH